MLKNSLFLKIAVLFLAITGAATLLLNQLNVPFGNIDYFKVHGYLFLFFIAAAPRLTLFFSSIAFGGVFWWLGFIFAPRLLIAILATISYWNTNKILVVISWLMALSGETTEKTVVSKKTYSTFKKDTFEAEYHVHK